MSNLRKLSRNQAIFFRNEKDMNEYKKEIESERMEREIENERFVNSVKYAKWFAYGVIALITLFMICSIR